MTTALLVYLLFVHMYVSLDWIDGSSDRTYVLSEYRYTYSPVRRAIYRKESLRGVLLDGTRTCAVLSARMYVFLDGL